MSAAHKSDDVHAFQARLQSDPLWGMREVFGAQFWPTQERIVESVWRNRHTAVPACHSSGKTHVAARIALLFLTAYMGSRVIITGPSDRQVKNVFWPELVRAHQTAKVPLGGQITTEKLTVDADWYALAFSATQYQEDRFSGFHAPYVLVIVDEASGIPQTITDQIAGVLSGGIVAHELQIGNPISPLSAFRDACDSPDYHVIPIDALATPNFTAFGIEAKDFESSTWGDKIAGRAMPYPQLITPEWAAEMYRRWGPKSPSWMARVRGRFTDVVEHAVYGEEMRQAKAESRITRVSHQKETGIVTGWDLGRGHAMVVWFAQQIGNELHVIDHERQTGKDLPWFAAMLQRRAAERGYVYRRHLAPHDIGVTEIGTGKTRLETAQKLGINFEVVPKLSVDDGIEVVKALLGRTYFDQDSTKEGVAALSSYRWDMDAKSGASSREPVQDWSTDDADAFRTLAVGLRPNRPKAQARRPDTRWVV